MESHLGSTDPAAQSSHLYKDSTLEFLVCLLPSYIFLALALYRLFEIRHFGHTYNQPDLFPLTIIKIIAYAMTMVYGVLWVMSYLNSEAINLSRDNLDLAVLYFFPMAAWYWSYELTNTELKRKLTPMQTNQFLFWSLSIVVSVYKFLKEPEVRKLFIRMGS